MIVNGTDIKQKYGSNVIWLKQEIKPRTIINYENWLDNAFDPVKYKDNSYREFEIYIEMIVKGDSMQECELIRSSLIKDFDSGIIKLDNMTFSHDFNLKSENAEPLNRWKYRYEITLTAFNKLGSQEMLSFRGTEYTFDVKGTAKAPAILTLSSDIGLNSLTVEGLTEEIITINQVQEDSVIIIDGENCLITENGQNILGKTDLWEFPELKPGTSEIKLSSQCTAQLSYYPRYK